MALVVLGSVMVSSEEWMLKIVGGVFLIGAVLFIIATPFLGLPRRGPCPRCKWPMESIGRRDRDMLCPMCCSYFDAENEKLFLVKDPDRIRNEPTYAVPTPWEDLEIVTAPTINLTSSFQEAATESALKKIGNRRVWQPKWPPGCCVCRKPVVRRASLITPIVKHLKIMKEDIEIVLMDVPYCGEHDNGVRMTTVIFSDKAKNMRFSLLFRSLTYRNAFFDLNPGVFYKKT